MTSETLHSDIFWHFCWLIQQTVKHQTKKSRTSSYLGNWNWGLFGILVCYIVPNWIILTQLFVAAPFTNRLIWKYKHTFGRCRCLLPSSLFQKPHPRLPGCIFADHLCISYANPVGEVMREPPQQPGGLPVHRCGWKFDLCHSHSAAKRAKERPRPARKAAVCIYMWTAGPPGDPGSLNWTYVT